MWASSEQFEAVKRFVTQFICYPQGTVIDVEALKHGVEVLVEEGICTSREQAFSKYLGEKCKYYIPKPFFDPKDCLKLILDAGGIPVLAHPFLYKFSNKDTKQLIHDLKDYGLAGIEVYHSSHHKGQIAKCVRFLFKYEKINHYTKNYC